MSELADQHAAHLARRARLNMPPPPASASPIKQTSPVPPIFTTRQKRIQKIVCAHYGIELNEMLSRRKNPEFVWPRRVAIYLTHKLTAFSLPQIGRQFSRHHSLTFNAVRKIAALRLTDAQVALELDWLEAKIKETEQ